MEYDNDEQNTEGGIMERIKESPRTVSALIIILIVAAAIYAFSGDDNQQGELASAENNTAAEDTTEQTSEEEAAAEASEEGDAMEENSDEGSTNEGSAMEDGETQGAQDEATAEPVNKEELAQQSEELPQAEKTEQGYKEVAAAGDGVTHLARRATTRYLSENTVEYEITNEHRIYIEDYIKDRLGSQGLAVGETKTVSFDLIKEAVAAAGQLNDRQLQNLSQYTTALS